MMTIIWEKYVLTTKLLSLSKKFFMGISSVRCGYSTKNILSTSKIITYLFKRFSPLDTPSATQGSYNFEL
jgi:hypothetical protein